MIPLMLIGSPVVRQFGSGQADLRGNALQGAAGRINDPVALVSRPTDGSRVAVDMRAEFVDEVYIALRGIGKQANYRLLVRQAVIDGVEFRDWYAEPDARADCGRVIGRDRIQVSRIDFALVYVEAPAYPI